MHVTKIDEQPAGYQPRCSCGWRTDAPIADRKHAVKAADIHRMCAAVATITKD